MKEGFQPIIFPFRTDFSLKAKAGRYLFLLKTLFSLPPGAIVAFQFPLYARMHKLLTTTLSLRRSVRVICFLVDINGLRSADDNLLQQEIRELRRFRYFIVQNPAMASWLKDKIPGARYAILYFFDFLAAPFAGHRKKSFDIAFAGNLAKSNFVGSLGQVVRRSPKLQFHVYGPDPGAEIKGQQGLYYHGVFEPYQLPRRIEGSFGLVWDGEGTDGLSGSFGRYLQFNTSHKVSLYLLARLPLIVHEKAGSASLVREHGIGITVSSLHEMEEKIAGITEEAYELMCRNTVQWAHRISAGRQLRSALEDIIAQATQNSKPA